MKAHVRAWGRSPYRVLLLGSVLVFAGCAQERQAASQEQGGQVAVAMDPGSARARLLDSLHLGLSRCLDPIDAMRTKSCPAMVVDATPEVIGLLAANAEAVRQYTGAGGWLMLWGLTPAGLDPFNALVGMHHMLRPFTVESVFLPKHVDPLLDGLDPYQVLMFSNDRCVNDLPMRSGDAWSYVLDGEDLAPFCGIPDMGYWHAGQTSAPGTDQHPPNMVNGLDDAWQEGFTFPVSSPHDKTWTFSFPKRATVDQFSMIADCLYRKITTFQITFVNSASPPVTCVMKPDEFRRQDFPFPPASATGLTFTITGLSHSPADVPGIRNCWIHAVRNADERARVHSLLSIGVMNEYPMGTGGIIVNQMRVGDMAGNPINYSKQQAIMENLLSHLLHPTVRPSVPPQETHGEAPVSDDSVDVDAFEHPDDLSDTEAIRRSIYFAINHHFSRVTFSPRTYLLDNQLIIPTPNQVCLQGALTSDGEPATTLEFLVPDHYTPPISESPLISGIQTQRLILKY